MLFHHCLAACSDHHIDSTMKPIPSQSTAYLISEARKESKDLTSDLRKMLRVKYPNAHVDVVSSTSFHIDGQVRGFLREGAQSRSAESLGIGRNAWSSLIHRHARQA